MHTLGGILSLRLLVIISVYVLVFSPQETQNPSTKDQGLDLQELDLYNNNANLGRKEYPLKEFIEKPGACKKVKELGSSANTWALCVSSLQSPCQIFSFGVGFDYSFDIDANKKLGCEVLLFDPTPSVRRRMTKLKYDKMHYYPWGLARDTAVVEMKHNWWNQREPASVQLFSFQDILDRLNITKAPIVKLDIEGYEFEVIHDILNEKYGVQQVLLELHYGGIVNDDFRTVNSDYGGRRWLHVFNLLEQKGFEIFWKLGGRYDTKSPVCKKDPSSAKCHSDCVKDRGCKGALQEYGFIKKRSSLLQ